MTKAHVPDSADANDPDIFDKFNEYMKETLRSDEHLLGRLLMAYTTPYDFFREFVNKLKLDEEKIDHSLKPREEKGLVTISSIAENLEKEFESADQVLAKMYTPVSSRTLKRKFDALVDILGIQHEQLKDSKRHYSFEAKYEPFIAAFLLELTKSDGFANKMLEDKLDDIRPIDTINFFEAIANYSDMQVEKEINEDEKRLKHELQQKFLRTLDEVIQYQHFVNIYNIELTTHSIIHELALLPYEYTVMFSDQLDQACRNFLSGVLQFSEQLRSSK